MRSMSLVVSCVLATSDSSVSLKTSSSTAESAPRPESIQSGERSIRIDSTSTPQTSHSASWATCT
ncbi:hypothetical protein D3C87_1448640 [compost metagenome]